MKRISEDFDGRDLLAEAYLAGLDTAYRFGWRWSRTTATGELRVMCAMRLTGAELSINDIATRCGVSRRRVFSCLNEVRPHVEFSLPLTQEI